MMGNFLKTGESNSIDKTDPILQISASGTAYLGYGIDVCISVDW